MPFDEIPVTVLITSSAFADGEMIPRKYSCEGDNFNPPLNISDLPPGTQNLALIVEDPDTGHGVFDHWIVWNIPPGASVPENFSPGVNGINGKGKTGYTGPCPPSGIHRYFFKVFALDKLLDLPEGSSKAELFDAMKNHILSIGELIGKYKKSAPE